jgi:hypothetical protein
MDCTFWPTLRPVQLHLQWVLQAPTKQPEREAEHPRPFATSVKNPWSLPLLNHTPSWSGTRTALSLLNLFLSFISVDTRWVSQHARQRPSPFVSPHSTSVSGTELSLRRLIIFYVRKHFFRLTSGRLRTVRRIFVEDKRDYTVQYPVIVHSNGFCVVYGWHMTDDYSYMKICIKNSRHIEMVCTEILCN